MNDDAANSAPTNVALSNNAIAENAGPNAVVGTLSTTDPDVGDTHTYTLVSGTGGDDNSAFNISGTSLRANASFDFETDSSYTVRVRSTDAGGLFFEKAFAITVTNVNDAPSGTDKTLTVSEDAAHISRPPTSASPIPTTAPPTPSVRGRSPRCRRRAR